MGWWNSSLPEILPLRGCYMGSRLPQTTHSSKPNNALVWYDWRGDLMQTTRSFDANDRAIEHWTWNIEHWMATTLLITNELRKSLHFCEIQDFRRKILKYRILRVKTALSRSPLVDVFLQITRVRWVRGWLFSILKLPKIKRVFLSRTGVWMM